MERFAEDGSSLVPALERIQTALRGLRYGTVTAIVQDGVIVQVERTEKIRLDQRSKRDGSG
jgi:hypothetical protein